MDNINHSLGHDQDEDPNLLRSKQHKDMIKAASRGDLQTMAHLLDTYNLNLNYSNVCNETALHQAVLGGSIECAEELIHRGIKITNTTCFGVSILHNAARAGNEKLLTFLIEKLKANSSFISPLHDMIQSKSYDDRTPLHIAAGYGNVGCMKILIDHGASQNSKTESGMTPLAFAASRSQTESVAMLIEAGSNVNAKNFHGETPLHLALRRGKLEENKALLENLVAHGASLRCRRCKKKIPCSSDIEIASLEFVLEKRSTTKVVAPAHSKFSLFRRG
eukprot:TRINITY_DN12365_c0_g1_i1.p1 TRINITY_DN12365_c0_g1~~TRINITY_DN12365_c0_g1_i1.p1  ORF type:complete len:277 (-),score=56.42 TRINITY_DN12365_c0_g1_i1:197-1027(-)